MKTSAIVISALFASTAEAINVNQLAFMKAQEQLNGPSVGNMFPRFCDLGASETDVNNQGCVNKNYTVPVRSIGKAAVPAPAGGNAAFNYNNQTASMAPAKARAGHVWVGDLPSKNKSGGNVWVGDFAYIQSTGDANPSAVDPSAAATADPKQLAADQKAEAAKVTDKREGHEKEDEKLKKDPEADAKVEKEEKQSKAQGDAIKVLDKVDKAPAEPLAADEKVAWDHRAANDADRKAAAASGVTQAATEAKNVAGIESSIAKATEEAAKLQNVAGRSKEGVSKNNWHEYWVTNVVPQPTPNDYDHDNKLRAGKPTKEELEAAKANGASDKEKKKDEDAKKDAAPAKDEAPAKSLAQLKAKAEPSRADSEQAAYQKVWTAEQTRLTAAQKALADQITANEVFRSKNAVTNAQLRTSLAQTKGDPSRADSEEAAYQKVWTAEQTRLTAAQKALADQITANEVFRSKNAVTNAQLRTSLAQTKGDPSRADSEEAAYQKVWTTEQTRLKAAEKALATQITANETFRSKNAVTLVQEPSRADSEEAAYQKVWTTEQTRLKAAEKALSDQITANEVFRSKNAVTL